MTEEKEKKKLKSLIGFLSANKIDNYNRVGGGGGGEGEEKEKKKREKNFTELQKPKVEAEIYDNNKKNVTGEKKAQKLNWVS